MIIASTSPVLRHSAMPLPHIIPPMPLLNPNNTQIQDNTHGSGFGYIDDCDKLRIQNKQRSNLKGTGLELNTLITSHE